MFVGGRGEVVSQGVRDVIADVEELEELEDALCLVPCALHHRQTN